MKSFVSFRLYFDSIYCSRDVSFQAERSSNYFHKIQGFDSHRIRYFALLSLHLLITLNFEQKFVEVLEVV